MHAMIKKFPVMALLNIYVALASMVQPADSVWFYAYEHTVLRTLMCGVCAVTHGDYT